MQNSIANIFGCYSRYLNSCLTRGGVNLRTWNRRHISVRVRVRYFVERSVRLRLVSWWRVASPAEAACETTMCETAESLDWQVPRTQSDQKDVDRRPFGILRQDLHVVLLGKAKKPVCNDLGIVPSARSRGTYDVSSTCRSRACKNSTIFYGLSEKNLIISLPKKSKVIFAICNKEFNSELFNWTALFIKFCAKSSGNLNKKTQILVNL